MAALLSGPVKHIKEQVLNLLERSEGCSLHIPPSSAIPTNLCSPPVQFLLLCSLFRPSCCGQPCLSAQPLRHAHGLAKIKQLLKPEKQWGRGKV